MLNIKDFFPYNKIKVQTLIFLEIEEILILTQYNDYNYKELRFHLNHYWTFLV